MSQAKTVGWTGRGEPLEDPALIRQTMEDLRQLEAEFSIKVDGAQTLPYTSWVHSIDLKKGQLHLKLIRPLPHELAVGASFVMLFSAGDQRFEAPCIFQGREAYLLYRFTIPVLMATCDRRRHRRFPFRPREKAYVVVQDASVPGHGISGPLVNLCQGGLAFRVDRVMRLNDHLRITPGLGFFDRGKSFPMVKIRDLPNLPVFSARGVLTHSMERGGEIILGLQFGEFKEAELREIQLVLTIRENLQRAGSGPSGEGPRDPGPKRPPAAAKGPATRVSPAGSQTPDALRRLGRRSTRLVLAMAPGTDRDQVSQALRGGGFQRLEQADSLMQALADIRAEPTASTPLLVVETLAQDGFSMAGIRELQQELGASCELPVALITRGDAFAPSEDPLIRPMPWPVGGDLAWLPYWDDLAGLD